MPIREICQTATKVKKSKNKKQIHVSFDKDLPVKTLKVKLGRA